MRRVATLFVTSLLFAQEIPQPPRFPGSRNDREDAAEARLPNGKSQKEEIAKVEYRKSLEDADTLIRLSTELKAELEKNTRYVVNVSTIKKTEEIEKLVRKIRGRLKGN